MPIIWRYLLSHFLKVFIFCVIAFIAVLMTTRLDEIAHFATLGPEGIYILKFTLYQIPYILPIAIPVSCLISSIILIQRLSRTHELTALRASGIGMRSILAPILIAASFLTIANFYIVSELSTHSHLSTGLLKNELRSINPLLLLHNKHLMKLKGIFFNTMGPSKIGELASDVILAMPGKRNSGINVMLAKSMHASPSKFVGQDITMITSLNSKFEDRFDPLMIENIHETTTSIKDFSQMLQKKVWTLNNDHLRSPLLLVRLSKEKQALADAKAEAKPVSAQKQIQRCINRCYSEMMRRVSVALAVFTFTFMGASFGVSISRHHSNKGMFIVIGLAALYLVCFFSAKGIDHLLIASSVLYMAPHAAMILFSILTLNRANKGIES
jgi:lipopolysaccharide export system permease protein